MHCLILLKFGMLVYVPEAADGLNQDWQLEKKCRYGFWNLVLFPFLFPSLAFSSPAVWCRVFQSGVFSSPVRAEPGRQSISGKFELTGTSPL